MLSYIQYIIQSNQKKIPPTCARGYITQAKKIAKKLRRRREIYGICILARGRARVLNRIRFDLTPNSDIKANA